MNERKIYDAAKTKLAAVCNENGLLYRFSRDSYPLVLTIQPDSSLDGQLSMLEAGGRPGSRGASIKFLFVDGEVLLRQDGPMELEGKVLTKLTNLAKKLRDAWLNVFFAEAKERERIGCVEPDPEPGSEEFEEIMPDAPELGEDDE